MNRADRRRKQKETKGAKGARKVEASPKKPTNPALQHALEQGLHHHQAGNLRAAEPFYRQVLQTEPEQPMALHLLGVIAQQIGHHETALDFFNRAVAAQPGYVEALIFQGVSLRELGRLNEAVVSFQKALAHAPHAFEAHINLGHAYKELQRLDLAAPHYQKAAKLCPQDVDIHTALGDALIELNRSEESIVAYRAATALAPNLARAHLNLGVALKRAGQADDAMAAYRRALEIEPDYPAALLNFGNALDRAGQVEDAITAYRRALETEPNHPIVLLNLGNTLKDQGRFKEAEPYYRQAIAACPDLIDAHVNLGVVYAEQGHFDEALACYTAALVIDPADPGARNNLSHLQLLWGDFAPGWDNYEKRLEIKTHQNTPLFKGRRWAGEDLSGQRLAVSSEQGIGDEIMFASTFTDLPSAVREILIECDDRLLPLYQRSFPNFSFLGKSVRKAEPQFDPAADFQIPLGSLGKILRPNIDAFPRRERYLRAGDEQTRLLRKRYLEWSGGRPVIGISWHSKNSPLSVKKSTRLADWLPILSNPRYAFISLQYGNVDAEIEAFHAATGIQIFKDDGIDPLKDMDGFAAQIEALDAVISISNATVHLAGALGKPTLLMLSQLPDWRWQLEGAQSLWYSSLRLFRQTKLGDWQPVIQQVARELQRFKGAA